METSTIEEWPGDAKRRLLDALDRYLKCLGTTWISVGEGCENQDSFDRFVKRRLVAPEDYLARRMVMQCIADMPHTAIIASMWIDSTDAERERWRLTWKAATNLICAILAFDDPTLAIYRTTIHATLRVA